MTEKSELIPDDAVWSFGYGSNMNKNNLEVTKQVKVYEATRAYLTNWRLCFNIRSLQHIEPNYANAARGTATDVIYGVAFCLSRADMDRLNALENAYNTEDIVLTAYDGRKLKGQIYVAKPIRAAETDGIPSKRYRNLLINGAKAAGLDSDYIKSRLESLDYYIASDETKQRRKNLPKLEDLEAFSVEELAQYNGENEGFPMRYCVFGYIFESVFEIVFPSLKAQAGYDTTKRNLNHFYGRTQTNDGGPPYPIIMEIEKELPEGLEYVWNWFDELYFRADYKVVGYLKQFHEAQEIGKSDWK